MAETLQVDEKVLLRHVFPSKEVFKVGIQDSDSSLCMAFVEKPWLADAGAPCKRDCPSAPIIPFIGRSWSMTQHLFVKSRMPPIDRLSGFFLTNLWSIRKAFFGGPS
jgi:hypothetical protein